MPSQFNGLPTHVLAVHAAVVLVPLAALLGVLFAVPRTRSWSRVPLVLVSLGAAAAVYVARQTGLEFEKVLIAHQVLTAQNPSTDLVRVHAQRAGVLLYATLGYAVLAVLAYLVSRHASSTGMVTTLVAVLMVLGAAGVAFQTYRVGDVGARAVWNPDGTQNFSSTGSGG
jgi:glucan phosphoethanolaminetransferase (alkaline phosphatase superfamily)